MKQRFEHIVAEQAVNEHGRAVQSVDGFVLRFTDNEIGDPIFNEAEEEVGTYGLDNLKADIEREIVATVGRVDRLTGFAGKHDVSFDFLKYTDKPFGTIAAEMASLKGKATAIKNALAAVKNETALRNLPFDNAVQYCVPVPRVAAFQKMNIINDFLDAASYTLRGIDHDTGDPTGDSDSVIRTKAARFLRLTEKVPFACPAYLLDDFENMMTVAGNAFSLLGSSALASVIADYIDANVEKVPLIRRAWAD